MTTRLKLAAHLDAAGRPPRVALEMARRAGAEGATADASGDLAPDRLTATGRRELRTLLRSHGMELAALHVPLRRGLDSADEQTRRLEHVTRVLQLAADVGAKAVSVPLPRLPSDAASPKAVTLRESLVALAASADRLGAALALEVGLDGGAATRDYLGTFDAGALGVLYDPANFLLNGLDPFAELTPLAGLLRAVRARDGRGASVSGGGREVPVGAGDVEWMALMPTLEASGYRGHVAVDRQTGADRWGDVAVGLAFLRRFVVAPG